MKTINVNIYKPNGDIAYPQTIVCRNNDLARDVAVDMKAAAQQFYMLHGKKMFQQEPQRSDKCDTYSNIIA